MSIGAVRDMGAGGWKVTSSAEAAVGGSETTLFQSGTLVLQRESDRSIPTDKDEKDGPPYIDVHVIHVV